MSNPALGCGNQSRSLQPVGCSVIIVNWNAGSQLRQCVDSVLTSGGGYVHQIVVVDNASTDGSREAVEDCDDVRLIVASENLGFAAACNRGARQAESTYLLFLNPDTRVNQESFSVPLAFMERPENADIGICGIQLVDAQQGISRTCARFPTLGRVLASALGIDKVPGFKAAGIHMADWDHGDSRPVDHVIGAFFLMRRELFDAVDGFDERFFVYLEDLDLSRRARDAGWQCWYLTGTQAFHAGGGTSRQVKTKRLFYSLRSRLLYGFKHLPPWEAWVLVGVTAIIEPVTRSLYCLARGDGADLRHTWSAYRMLWRGMGRIVRGKGRFEP